MSPSNCGYCGATVRLDRGAWVDDTDGDGCDNVTRVHHGALVGHEDPAAFMKVANEAAADDWQALSEAANRYARQRAAFAARMVLDLFDTAHRVVFSQTEDLDNGLGVNLETIRDVNGALLWHSDTFEDHPDAVAVAEIEAYGGPARVHIVYESRLVIEALIEDAAYRAPIFPMADDPVQIVKDEHGIPQEMRFDGDLHELVIPTVLAAAQRTD